MKLFLLALLSNWQPVAVLVVLILAVAYLLARIIRKKGKSCGSAQCGCTKKKSS